MGTLVNVARVGKKPALDDGKVLTCREHLSAFMCEVLKQCPKDMGFIAFYFGLLLQHLSPQCGRYGFSYAYHNLPPISNEQRT